MAYLKDLIVSGSSRFLNKIYVNDAEVSNLNVIGTATFEGNLETEGTLNVGKSTAANAIIYLNNKLAMKGSDSWLRINEGKPFTSGVYFGSSIVRTDGSFHLGSGGSSMLLNTSSATFNIPITSSQSITNNGNIYNTKGTIETDIIKANVWDIVSTQNMGGNFYVCPTIMVKDGSTFYISSVSGTSITGYIIDSTNITSADFAGHTWSQNSKIKITGKLTSGTNTYVLGVCDGTLTAAMNTTANRINFTITCNASTVPPAGTYTISDGTVMMYRVGASNVVGIHMTSYGTNKYTYIDIYDGANGATPMARIGKLDGLAAINGANPTGYGIYTTNGYFQGLIVANGGKIGGWTIGDSYITTNTNRTTYDSTSQTGMTMTSGGIGGRGSASQYFTLSSNGLLTAVGATITTATIGSGTNKITLGVSSASSSYSAIKSGMTSLSDTTNDGFYIGNDGIALGKGVFKVTNAGVLTAKSGTIGGSNITASSLYSGSKSAYNSNNSGYYLGSDGKFGLGNSSNYIQYNGSNLYIKGNLTLTSGTSVENYVSSEISNIQVGGRNLLRNSQLTNTDFPSTYAYTVNMNGVGGEEKRSTGWYYYMTSAQSANPDTSGGEMLWFTETMLANMGITYGDTITVSINVRGKVHPDLENNGFRVVANDKLNTGAWWYNSNPTILWGEVNLLENISETDFIRTWATITLPQKTSSSVELRFGFGVYVGKGDASTTYWAEVKNAKIEKGNKATDWTPAPEDLESEVVSLETRVSTAESKITDSAIVNTVRNSTNYQNDLSSITTKMTAAGMTGTNLLEDAYAPSTDKVNAKYNRYFSNSQNSTTTCEFIEATNETLPDPNATHFVRITNTETNNGRGLSFYNCSNYENAIGFVKGEIYKASCWMRQLSGSSNAGIAWYNTPDYTDKNFVPSDKWERYEILFTYSDYNETIATYATRMFFNNMAGDAINGAGTGIGQIDMCGFRVEHINVFKTIGRNLCLRSKSYEGWGTNNGTTFVSDSTTDKIVFPTVTTATWREAWQKNNIPYSIVRNQKVVVTCKVKGEVVNGVGNWIAINICPSVVSTETSDSRLKYRNKYITLRANGDWQTVCMSMYVNDSLFTVGSGTPDYDNCYFHIRVGARSDSTYGMNGFAMKEIMVALGSEPCVWSEAPEDLEASIDSDVGSLAGDVAQLSTDLNTKIDQTQTSILSTVSESYYLKTDANNYISSQVSTSIKQLKDSVEIDFGKVQSSLNIIDGKVSANQTNLEKYIRFEDGDIILGETGNSTQLRIENDQMTFSNKTSGVPIAYFKTDGIMIPTGSSMVLGNYQFVPRENGSLDFKKVG